ncbi:hypothetical protein CISIN_1g043650mg [Citrus sinensis]|uniref:Uncharacterized protein n=1 Tax=Citrus sinensis TaxID=2711 RepID=A0A067DIT4_CITSI|nr:hypothetical protein CISIN_1g043650mg [Citrus sinensis]
MGPLQFMHVSGFKVMYFFCFLTWHKICDMLLKKKNNIMSCGMPRTQSPTLYSCPTFLGMRCLYFLYYTIIE